MGRHEGLVSAPYVERVTDGSHDHLSAPPSLAARLTIIVVTSPLPRHPCIALLELVVASLHRHIPGAAACRILIVADGYSLVDADTTPRFKKGKIDVHTAACYEVHKAALREASKTALRSSLAGAELLEQSEHMGFAFCVQRALVEATTEYVLVQQHDRPLVRGVPLGPLLEAMDLQPALHHVSLPTGRTLARTYEEFARGAGLKSH